MDRGLVLNIPGWEEVTGLDWHKGLDSSLWSE